MEKEKDFANLQMPQIDPKEYESITCDKCGNVAFMPAMILKIIPGLLLGTGAENRILPDQILVCSKCGTVIKKDREYYNLDIDGKPITEKVENKKSDIII